MDLVVDGREPSVARTIDRLCAEWEYAKELHWLKEVQCWGLTPNVRVNRPAEASAVSPD
jgi:hypothetical protein